MTAMSLMTERFPVSKHGEIEILGKYIRDAIVH
jgi:hypothetical protein